ncbi:MAG: hypothetical protein A2X99_04520 [Deltaproteobacteria bacterium GWB2_55_19]|nr:MAG: hypothetical protein A2X99_04520 [Deltaproteobacteria bacterium GWB2_55_19]HAO94191.1 hypothetical protein [Deltaproteobacteria bacterium]
MTDSENNIDGVLRDAKRLFESLKAAGIAYIAVKKAEPQSPPEASSATAPIDAGPQDADAWSAKVGFEAGTKAVVFCLWRIGGALFAAGRTVHSGDTNPFPEVESVQAQKLLSWFAGEIRAEAVSEPLILSATAMKDNAQMNGAVLSIKPLIDEKIGEWKSSVIVALGGLAALIFTGSLEIGRLRGRIEARNGLKIAVTHSLGDIVKKQVFKKESHEDMKMVIRALQAEA